MAEFRKWRVDFDANESGTVDKRRVPDPPGYEASAGREVVRLLEGISKLGRAQQLACSTAGQPLQSSQSEPMLTTRSGGISPADAWHTRGHIANCFCDISQQVLSLYQQHVESLWSVLYRVPVEARAAARTWLQSRRQ